MDGNDDDRRLARVHLPTIDLQQPRVSYPAHEPPVAANDDATISPPPISWPHDLSFRQTEEADLASLMRFYVKNRERHVVLRSADEHRTAITQGLHVLIESGSRGIVAAAAVFVGGSCAEFGNALVHPDFRRFELHHLLVGLRVLAVSTAPAARDRHVMTAIDPTNTKAWRNAMQEGFVRWNEAPPELFEPCRDCGKRASLCAPGRQCCCEFLTLPYAKRLRCVQELRQRQPPIPTVRKSDGARCVVRDPGGLLDPVRLAAILDDLSENRPIDEDNAPDDE